jgi:hypothetical protein
MDDAAREWRLHFRCVTGEAEGAGFADLNGRAAVVGIDGKRARTGGGDGD